MTPEEIGVWAGLGLAIMTAWNKLVKRRRANIAERMEQERRLQEKLNEEALEKAKSAKCACCGTPIFPTFSGKCTECLVARKC